MKYTEAILSNSTRKLLSFEITKMLIAVKKINSLCYLLQLLLAHFRSLFHGNAFAKGFRWTYNTNLSAQQTSLLAWAE